MTSKRLMIAPMALLLASVLSAQSNEPAWELADPNAKLLMGIDVRSIRESALGQAMSAQMKGQAAPYVTTPFRIPGIELLDDIDSVFVASTGEPATTAAAPGAKPTMDTNPPVLLVVKGTFPTEHLQPLLSGKHPSYKAFNIYGSNGANLAVMDDHTLVFGDTKSIRSAIDRRTVKLTTLTPLFARAQEMAAANDIWVVANGSSFGSKTAGNPIASEINGLELGVSVHSGFGFDLNLGTKTEAAAAMFAQLVSMQVQSAVAGRNDPALTEAAKRLQVGTQGNRMTIHMALTPAEMEQTVRSIQAARMNTGGASVASAGPAPLPTAAANAQPSKPATPPGPRKVRIYGLDEGVREITIDPRP